MKHILSGGLETPKKHRRCRESLNHISACTQDIIWGLSIDLATLIFLSLENEALPWQLPHYMVLYW